MYAEKIICFNINNNLACEEWKPLLYKRIIFDVFKNAEKNLTKSNLSIYCKVFMLPLLAQTCQFYGKYAEFF